jgi:hypothetical protein
MKQITHTAIGAIAAVLLLTGTVAARSSGTAQPLPAATTAKQVTSAPIALASHPGSPADRIARQLLVAELDKSRRSGEHPLLLVGTARLGNSDVLFVQIQSTGDCGSAGCSTLSFRKVSGKWSRILDTVAGAIRVAESSHRGMPDLIVKDTSRLIWDGTKYG